MEWEGLEGCLLRIRKLVPMSKMPVNADNHEGPKLPQISSLTTCVSVRSLLMAFEHVNRSASRSM